jgi:dTDP-4-amino-4,6-dideoxygalactose transaminase
MLRDWGTERKYDHRLKGYNYRMEGFQGAVLRVKLRHLPQWNEARVRHAKLYDSLLAGSAVCTPVEMPYARHVYHVYAVRTSAREALQQVLSANGIQSAVHYPIPVHLQEAYREPQYGAGDFPVSEAAARELLSLPVFPELTVEQIGHVAGVCGAWSPHSTLQR